MQDYRANHRIRAREVFLVDASGQKLGVVNINDAMSAARQAGLDLVEVSGNTNPPVCKILDFGKFRYELAKRDREAKRHNLAAKVKEMKFHVNIDPHDYGTKMRHAEDFLWKGMKVKVVMAFRGRGDAAPGSGESPREVHSGGPETGGGGGCRAEIDWQKHHDDVNSSPRQKAGAALDDRGSRGG